MSNATTSHDVAKIIASALADERMKRHREELLPPDSGEERHIAREAAVQFLRSRQGANMWGLSNDLAQDEALIDEAIAHVLGLGKLQPLLEDAEISDIHIRGNRPVWLKMRSGERREHAPIVANQSRQAASAATPATRGLTDDRHPAQLPMPQADPDAQDVLGRPA